MATFRTLDLLVEYFRLVEGLEIKGNLKDQFLRAASSISLNLSEGNAKTLVKENKRFFQIAYRSLKESQTARCLLKDRNSEIDKMGREGQVIRRITNKRRTARFESPILSNRNQN